MGAPMNLLTLSDSVRLRTAAATILLTVACQLSSSQTGDARAESGPTAALDNSGNVTLSPAKAEADIRVARDEMAANPGAEAPVNNLVDALARAGRKRDALAEADLFVERGAATAMLHAQRGFLRRELNDTHGATEDFTVALAGDSLTPNQRRNVEAGLVEARTAEALNQLARAEAALKQRNFDVASKESSEALQRNPNSEAAICIRIEALSRMGRKRDAAAEADRFIARYAASAVLKAQRGFLRRELNDTAGAAEDFTAALAVDGLSVEQRHNIQAALAEARTAERQADYDRAQAALTRGDFKTAADVSKAILQRDPNSEAAMRIRIDALSRTGRKRELQAEVDRLIARGRANGWAYAQRGFARRDAENFQGAVQDFDAALGRGVDRRSVADIRYARAHAAAMQAEREGNPHMAEASYRELVQAEPTQADGWFNLGYFLLQQKRRPQGAEALNKGLEIRPVGAASLDAANASIFTNAPLASKFYREGLDRWYAGDPSLAGRPGTELERVKNEVVEADATIRTAVSVGGIAARPEAAGGANNAVGAETRLRFDGRYLPAVEGLEVIARGLTGKDSNGERETDAAIGLRYRPIPDLNLYFGGAVDHFFQPDSETQFVLNWGLGLGSDAYPYMTGWKPYWDFATFGVWRTADGRVLEDVRGNAGFLYEFRAPVRAAIGPTILAVAGYDNQAANPWGAGIGPSVLSYFWLGGDKYRSYDAVLSLQFGYLFNIGDDERQRGWRGQIGVTF